MSAGIGRIVEEELAHGHGVNVVGGGLDKFVLVWRLKCWEDPSCQPCDILHQLHEGEEHW